MSRDGLSRDGAALFKTTERFSKLLRESTVVSLPRTFPDSLWSCYTHLRDHFLLGHPHDGVGNGQLVLVRLNVILWPGFHGRELDLLAAQDLKGVGEQSAGLQVERQGSVHKAGWKQKGWRKWDKWLLPNPRKVQHFKLGAKWS